MAVAVGKKKRKLMTDSVTVRKEETARGENRKQRSFISSTHFPGAIAFFGSVFSLLTPTSLFLMNTSLLPAHLHVCTSLFALFICLLPTPLCASPSYLPPHHPLTFLLPTPLPPSSPPPYLPPHHSLISLLPTHLPPSSPPPYLSPPHPLTNLPPPPSYLSPPHPHTSLSPYLSSPSLPPSSLPYLLLQRPTVAFTAYWQSRPHPSLLYISSRCSSCQYLLQKFIGYLLKFWGANFTLVNCWQWTHTLYVHTCTCTCVYMYMYMYMYLLDVPKQQTCMEHAF